ncbi:OmpH family outer membrane protein [Sneathiella limimaris]|uniref:OmpH family outer membrane protein n=1 Tax=Sneathiella limimaris TaxID=1964213 RepID=UPI001469A01A|nr:OmpH family outer membrane protein [Sneathiella limimaris]
MALLPVLLVLTTANLSAEEGQRIAVLDLGKVLINSLAMQDIDRQLKTADQKLKTDVQAQEQTFREEQQKLNEQRAILAPEVFRQKVDDLNRKGASYRNDYQKKVQQLARSRSVAIRKIEKTMEPIVSDIANAVGATMIVEKSNIIFGVKSLNISDEVIKRLNTQLKSLKLEIVPLSQAN